MIPCIWHPDREATQRARTQPESERVAGRIIWLAVCDECATDFDEHDRKAL